MNQVPREARGPHCWDLSTSVRDVIDHFDLPPQLARLWECDPINICTLGELLESRRCINDTVLYEDMGVEAPEARAQLLRLVQDSTHYAWNFNLQRTRLDTRRFRRGGQEAGRPDIAPFVFPTMNERTEKGGPGNLPWNLRDKKYMPVAEPGNTRRNGPPFPPPRMYPPPFSVSGDFAYFLEDCKTRNRFAEAKEFEEHPAVAFQRYMDYRDAEDRLFHLEAGASHFNATRDHGLV